MIQELEKNRVLQGSAVRAISPSVDLDAPPIRLVLLGTSHAQAWEVPLFQRRLRLTTPIQSRKFPPPNMQ